jgi:hypothetical protein
MKENKTFSNKKIENKTLKPMKASEILQKILDSQLMNATEFAKEIGLYGPQPLYNILNDKYGLSVKLKRQIKERFPEIDDDFLNGKTETIQKGGAGSINIQGVQSKVKTGSINQKAEEQIKYLRAENKRLLETIEDYKEREKKLMDLLLKQKET